MGSYHFFTANLSRYNDSTFEKLSKENDEENGLIWKISSENRKRIYKVKKNDICFIYYANLPDGSNRILLKGVVEETDYGKQDNQKLMYDDEKGILGVKLKITSIALEDPNKFSREALRSKYGFNEDYHFQGYMDLSIKKYEKLLHDLLNDESTKSKLKTVMNYFNDNYCLCEFKTVGGKHDTFIEENGFYYIERHHLIERNLISKYFNAINNIDKIIGQKENIFLLCPNCHRKIHHGKKEVRRDMIKHLYNLRKHYFDSNFNEIKNGQDSLDWLYNLYKIND